MEGSQTKYQNIFWKWSRLQLIENRATGMNSNITSDLSVKITLKPNPSIFMFCNSNLQSSYNEIVWFSDSHGIEYDDN